jgi:hypothetical protein
VLVIAVADQGPGVPAPLREQIFAPYVRGPARADAQGSGLGLAVVRRIARRHGGEVTLSHPAGAGACFEVAIRAAPPIRPHRNGQPVRRGASASRARVLIVDDDPINRAVTVHMLASLDLARRRPPPAPRRWPRRTRARPISCCSTCIWRIWTARRCWPRCAPCPPRPMWC